jgi:pyrroline-5-carboxylate reductase
MNLSIVGGGNLGVAIAKGVREANACAKISVSRRNVARIFHLKEIGISVTDDNLECIRDADMVIVAVKPFQVERVFDDIRDHVENKIIVSVVTGKDLNEIETLLGRKNTIFRAMPNIAISQKESMTCISYRNGNTGQKDMVESLFSKMGEIIFVDDNMMDACTVMAACGIAYAMRFIRAAMQAAIQIGFDSNAALKIVTQTVLGAAQLLKANESHPEQEIDKVTTPKGCTIVGLNKMEHEGFSSSVIQGIQHSFEAIDKIKLQ